LRRRALLAAALALLLPACASRAPVRVRTGPATGVVPPPGAVFSGIASWYGPGYDGKRTSSGERFEQDALTAAHASWAFGTRVKVTLLSSDRSVVVRINDRFPPFKGRLLDLSRGAARKIGLVGPGTGTVRVEVLEPSAAD
jgi:rare lipoprotein A